MRKFGIPSQVMRKQMRVLAKRDAAIMKEARSAITQKFVILDPNPEATSGTFIYECSEDIPVYVVPNDLSNGPMQSRVTPLANPSIPMPPLRPIENAVHKEPPFSATIEYMEDEIPENVVEAEDATPPMAGTSQDISTAAMFEKIFEVFSEIKKDMRSIKADVEVLKGETKSVLISSRQMEVALGAVSDRMDRLEGTIDGIATKVHGTLHEPVVQLPIRTFEELDGLIRALDEDPSNREALKQQFAPPVPEEQVNMIRHYFSDEVLGLYTKSKNKGKTICFKTCPVISILKGEWMRKSGMSSIEFDRILSEAIRKQRGRVSSQIARDTLKQL